MTIISRPRPFGITALSIFFLFGAVISFTVFVSLIFPGTFLEPMWRLNPRAREAFMNVGAWAIVLMFAVCLSCALAAAGLWRGARWGYRMALALLVVDVPIVIVILTYLTSQRVRRFFRRSPSRA